MVSVGVLWLFSVRGMLWLVWGHLWLVWGHAVVSVGACCG